MLQLVGGYGNIKSDLLLDIFIYIVLLLFCVYKCFLFFYCHYFFLRKICFFFFFYILFFWELLYSWIDYMGVSCFIVYHFEHVVFNFIASYNCVCVSFFLFFFGAVCHCFNYTTTIWDLNCTAFHLMVYFFLHRRH